jgi:hypothetical protein
MREEMIAGQELQKEQMLENMAARIEAINEKFEVREGILVSRMDAHHAKTVTNHEGLMAAMKASQE